MANAQIDPKYLTGLTYRSSKLDKGGKPTPVERALTPADVLDWQEKGSAVVIVTADGKKYTVSAKVKPSKAEDLIAAIKEAATIEQVEEIIGEDKRATVVAAADARREELKAAQDQ